MRRAEWTSALFAGEVRTATAGEALGGFPPEEGEKEEVEFWMNPFERCAFPNKRCNQQDERYRIDQVGVDRRA